MKKAIFSVLLMAAAGLFAEVPEDVRAEFKDSSATFFDAGDFAKNYGQIKMTNKSAEKIEANVYAYDERPDKKTGRAAGWIKFGTLKVKDYKDESELSRQIKYKVTPVKTFRYFAYTTSKTQMAVKYELSYSNEVFEILASYENAIRPLASLEAKPQVEKNPENKKQVLGTKALVSFRNVSGKAAKSVILTMRASDKGLVSRTNDGKEEPSIIVSEIVEDGETFKCESPVFWNNTAINKIEFTRVKVEFTDGTEDEYTVN